MRQLQAGFEQSKKLAKLGAAAAGVDLAS
jgi:hypothetical protein